MSEPEIQVLPDAQAIVAAAAELLRATAEASVAARGRFALALAGGSTPKALYRALATPPLRERLPWDSTLLFWGDERYVAPDHPDSNQRMAREAFIDAVPIPDTQIYPLPVSGDPEADAASYEATIRATLAGDPPRFDLVLLGLGPDGHTASLFPGTTALDEHERLVAATFVAKFDAWRLTMTLPLLNNAALTVFLVAGQDKAEAARAVLRPSDAEPPLPARLLRPQGRLLWLLDAPAASLL
jgi:6-phosphogluconolactonase